MLGYLFEFYTHNVNAITATTDISTTLNISSTIPIAVNLGCYKKTKKFYRSKKNALFRIAAYLINDFASVQFVFNA